MFQISFWNWDESNIASLRKELTDSTRYRNNFQLVEVWRIVEVSNFCETFLQMLLFQLSVWFNVNDFSGSYPDEQKQK